MRAIEYAIIIRCGQTSMITTRPTLQSALAEAFRMGAYYADPNVAEGRAVSAEITEECATCNGSGVIPKNPKRRTRFFRNKPCPDCKGGTLHGKTLRFPCKLHKQA